MKHTINFIAPHNTPEAYDKLIDAISRGLGYEQAKDWLADIGYYLPEDQFKSVNELFNAQMNLEIGHRREELK